MSKEGEGNTEEPLDPIKEEALSLTYVGNTFG